MQIAGEPERVKLKINLERYGKGLIKGMKGWTIPNTKLSIWGDLDKFVAVKFDNGLELDILYESLEKISTNDDKNNKTHKEENKENVVEDRKDDKKK